MHPATVAPDRPLQVEEVGGGPGRQGHMVLQRESDGNIVNHAQGLCQAKSQNRSQGAQRPSPVSIPPEGSLQVSSAVIR